ncbi:MAG: bifunctional isocitrate dehydrogenase kinase/phosphatase [Gammaproteobacteria bacterium]
MDETLQPAPDSGPVSASARRIARAILNGFESYFAEFQNITLGARRRFETANWRAVQDASIERLDLYKIKVNRVARLVGEMTSKDLTDTALWGEAKLAYAQLVSNHANYEIAETFFNSIFCTQFKHWHIHDRNLFVLPSRMLDSKPLPEYSIYVRYGQDGSLEAMLERLLDDFAFAVSWEDKARDVAAIAGALRVQLFTDAEPGELRLEMLESVFYRNKAAYIVGRASVGGRVVPVILPCLNNAQGGVFIDTLLRDADAASIVFSFTRTYFMVDAPVPSRYVRFLHSLMPQKSIDELYNSMGFNKHGKTEFYRDVIRHMRESEDLYVIAPGIKGMVMTVFTLPSYGVVFKVIKDRFDPPKQVTEAIVREKYRLVSRSDRAGRMADTQEYSNFIFYRNRFSEELIEELQRVAPSKLWMDDKWIIIRHLYVERRMVPLNIYLAGAGPEAVMDAMDEYGNSIKQMAAANIFPGDMLLKNFGVTRHGRVVFSDYDEICLLTECNFRKIPEPRNEEDAMSGQPWYTVSENDVFPEEFRLFFSGNPRAKAAFEAHHADLYDYRYWQGLQAAIRDGFVFDTFPYRRSKRFLRPGSAPTDLDLPKDSGELRAQAAGN